MTFVFDDISDIFSKMSDVEKAEWKKYFAEIRTRNLKGLIFKIHYKGGKT
jgi:hypothetical protein